MIRNPLYSDDTEATLAGVAMLGADVERDGGDLHISSRALRAASQPVDARNSGTTIRFLSGVASLLDGATTLTGDTSIRRRPMGPLVEALNALGARARAFGADGRPPLEVHGVLRGGTISLAGGVSSQFLSSLLIASPLARGPTEIHLVPPTRSEPYVAMTRSMMRAYGVDVDQHGDLFRVDGGQTYRPVDVEVPGDLSSAAFPLAAAALTEGDVSVTGFAPEPPQGDHRIVDFLRAFGARVDEESDRVRVRAGSLIGQTVDVGANPDLFPILAVLAAHAEGETEFVGGDHLREKESDRIATTVSMLRALGVPAKPTTGGCILHGPRQIRSGFVDAQGDHRILMAAAVAGLAADGPVEISDPGAFRVSYPSFLDHMRSLGADHSVIE